MSDSKQRARARDRPVLPDPPFLCSTCHHGRMIGQKLQPWMLGQEPWQDSGPGWLWRVNCTSPKVTPWKFTVFWHPVVECDAYRPRKLLTTEDIARKQAKRERKRRKKKNKNRKRKKR
ncbi:MAG: hypothetical protein QNJ90_09135 [Planctomycetota bacterium]|nr:hypothetical protein [Planctomycetota bacterium]